jgi:uncharacterized repeat protein (TIGR03803 family)
MRISRSLLMLALTGLCMFLTAQVPTVTVTDLHDFNPSAGDPSNFNSTRPAQGRDGNFYTESRNGGTANQGTVFSVSPIGTAKVILSFDGTNGSQETGGVTLGTDGELYGNTFSGGTLGNGVTFKVTTGGSYAALHNFANTGDGVAPVNALVIGNDGNFYGLTDSKPETFYKVTPAGVLTTLHAFSTAQGFQGGQLSLGSDGNFYGGMNLGGTHSFGTAFKVTPTGALTVLHNFTGADGTDAATGMVQGGNGAFYGTASVGGTNNAGVVYKLTSTGAFGVLHNFVPATDGSLLGVLTLATDGNFYGIAISGGTSSCGTIFKVTPASAFSVVYTFDNTHGCNPEPYLTQGTNGKLYGLTNAGGAHANGTFFSLNVGLAPFASLLPSSGKVGSKIGILGQGFSASSIVKFNGVKATTVVPTGKTFLLATVPAGATDGKVTVTTGTTTLTSAQTFIVHNSWSSGKTMPTPRMAGAIGVINGKIYVVSGATVSGLTTVNEIYNPATNTWTTGAPIPTARFAVAGAVVNGILYVMGGADSAQTPLSVVEAYDPITNTWTTKAPMPTPDDSMTAVVENGLIYVVGGFTSGARSAIVQRYNPAANTWMTEAPLLLAKSGSTLGLLGTTIISTGGLPNTGNPTGDTEGYHAASNSWSALKADLTVRQAACGASIAGQLYVAGGSGSGMFSDPLNLNESYNLTTNAWTTQAPMPKAVIGAMPAVANNNLLYCVGGTDDGRLGFGNFFNNVQIYQP